MAEGPHDREAQTAFKKLPDDAKGSFEAAAKALGERFEPQSKRELYVAEFQMRHKRKTEGWGDFGEDLRVLANRAFLQVNTDAKQLLALQHPGSTGKARGPDARTSLVHQHCQIPREG